MAMRMTLSSDPAWFDPVWEAELFSSIPVIGVASIVKGTKSNAESF
jgi:hypothetical protein